MASIDASTASLLAFVIAALLAPVGSMVGIASLEPYQAPPPLPATIYGNVSIVCQATGEVFDAPAGLHIRAYYENGTLAAETTTGSGTSGDNQYALQVSGYYSGDVYLYVESVYITTVTVSSGSVERVDITVNETEPPTMPANLTVLPEYSSNPTISWEVAADNLLVDHYIVLLYNANGSVVYNETTNDTSWSPPENLADGIYVVNVSAVDLSCNTGPQASKEFIVDTTPPSLIEASPANGSLLPTTTLHINLTVLEELTNLTASLTLDGASLVATLYPMGEGTWIVEADATVEEGQHTLNVTLEDSAGNSVEYTLYFTIDSTPPSIALTSGPEGAWINTSSTSFEFQLADNVSGVNTSSVIVLLDNETVPFNLSDSTLTVTLAGIPEGWHTLHVEASDNAGNTAGLTVEFGVDLTLPSIVVAEPVNGSIYAASIVEVNATLSDMPSGVDSNTISVLLDAVGVGFEYNASTGELTATLEGLADGWHTLRIETSDRAGNSWSTDILFIVDTTPPSIELVSGPEGDWISDTSTAFVFQVSDGIAGVDASSIMVELDGRSVGTFTWSDGVIQVNLNGLTDGWHTLTLTVRDLVGNTATYTAEFGVDTEPPSLELSAGPAGQWISASEATFTFTLTDTLSGVESVSVTLDGAPVGFTYAGSTLSVSLSSLLEGWHTLAVEAGDAAGNTISIEVGFGVDRTSPSISVDEPVNGSTYNVSTVSVSAEVSDSLSGVDPDSVTVLLNGESVPFSFDADTGELTATLESLNDGEYNLIIEASDKAGNTRSVTVHFTVDTGLPTVMVESPVDGAYYSTGSITMDLSVSDSSGLSSVTIYLDGDVLEECSCSGSEWSYTTTVTLEEGQHNLTIVATDDVDNTRSVTILFWVDTTPPTVELVSPPPGGDIVNTRSYCITAVLGDNIALDPDSIQLALDGSPVDYEFDPSTGELTACLSTIEEGNHTIEVEAADRAGNTVTATTWLAVDLTPPNIDILSPVDGGVYSDSTINIEVQVTDSLSGVDSDTISVLLDGEPLEFTYDPSTGQLTAVASGLTDGVHTLAVAAGDLAGNNMSAQVTFTIDTEAPSLELSSGPSGEWVSTTSVEFTFTLTDTVSGVDQTSIVVELDGSLVPYTYDSDSGILTVTLSSVPEGWHTLHVEASDNAGNTAGLTVEFGVDTTPPSVSITQPAEGSVLNTTNATIEAQVTDTPSGVDSITVSVDGTPIDYVYDPGTGQVTAYATGLAEGTHTLTITATDKAGNSYTSTVSFTVDLTEPTVQVYSPEPEEYYADPTVTINATVTDNVGLESAIILLDGEQLAACTCDGASEWSYSNTTTLEEGAHNLTIVAVDLAGNTASHTIVFAVDITPPIIVLETPENGSATNNETVELEALVTDNLSGINASSIAVTLDGEPVEYTFNPDTGEITAILEGLAQGWHTLHVEASDNAGNTISVTATFAVDLEAPEISILTPINGTVYATPTITLEASLTDTISGVDTGSITVEVDGSPVDFTYDPDTGALEANLTLPEDWHTLQIQASDKAGNSRSVELTFAVDTTPPEATVLEPSNGSAYPTSDVGFNVSAADTVGLSVVEVYLDGSLILECNCSGATSWSYTGVLEDLGEGAHNFTLVAIDQAGSSSVSTATFTVDLTPPGVELVSGPAGMWTNTSNTTFTFQIYDNVTVVRSIEVLLDSEPVSYQYQGGVLNVELVGVEDGWHTLTVVAVDTAGNAANYTVGFGVDTQPPTVVISSPVNMSLAPAPLVEVAATAQDNIEIASISVLVDGVPVDFNATRYNGTVEITFTANVSLAGMHTVEVQVWDPAGHTASTSIVVLADWEPPVIEVAQQYIEVSQPLVIVAYAYDDAIQALQALGFTLVVSGPFTVEEWLPNGTLILVQAGELPAATPVEVTITLTDLANRTATATTYAVAAKPIQVNTTVKPGLNLVGLYQGFVPSVATQALEECGNYYVVLPNWTITGELTGHHWIAIEVNATAECSLAYEGFLVDNSTYKLLSTGKTGILIASESIPLDELEGLGEGWILYTLDPVTGKWMIAASTGAGILGDFNSTKQGAAYFAYTPSGVQPASTSQGLAAPAKNSHDQASSKERAPVASIGLAAASVAAAGWSRRGSRRLAFLVLLATALAGLAAPAALAQSGGAVGIVTGTPPETVTAVAGDVVELEFHAYYENSYQSLVILELQLPPGFNITTVELTVNGVPQAGYTLETRTDGTVALIDQDLQPANGNLTLTVGLATPAEPGSYNVTWRFVAGATTQLAPMPPDDRRGQVTVELAPPPTTTTSPPANTTTGTMPPTTTSPPETTTTPSTTGTTTQPGTSQTSQATTGKPTGTTTHTPPQTTTTTTEKPKSKSTLTVAAALVVVGVLVVFYLLRRRG